MVGVPASQTETRYQTLGVIALADMLSGNAIKLVTFQVVPSTTSYNGVWDVVWGDELVATHAGASSSYNAFALSLVPRPVGSSTLGQLVLTYEDFVSQGTATATVIDISAVDLTLSVRNKLVRMSTTANIRDPLSYLSRVWIATAVSPAGTVFAVTMVSSSGSASSGNITVLSVAEPAIAFLTQRSTCSNNELSSALSFVGPVTPDADVWLSNNGDRSVLSLGTSVYASPGGKLSVAPVTAASSSSGGGSPTRQSTIVLAYENAVGTVIGSAVSNQSPTVLLGSSNQGGLRSASTLIVQS
jgi:hypothetical protein